MTNMDTQAIILFNGAAYSEQKDASLMYSVFTKHVGGSFDLSCMNEGCSFEMTYTGEKYGLDLVLISHSGSNRWGRMSANEVKDNNDGSYTAYFNYNGILESYGTNFTRLDEVRAVSNTDEKMTCYTIKYVPGNGNAVDTSDGKWSKASSGIAFIGDSITQNVFYNEGDFNTLLGRTDCVNFGIGGQTSRHMLARIGEVADRSFSKLVIWCGINDIGYGLSADETFANITAMVSKMREKNVGMKFIIISILPTSPAFYTNEQNRIIERNSMLAAYANTNEDVSFVDCFGDFIAEDGYCRDGLTLDGLHPNSAGYAIVKEHLLKALED